MTRYVGSFDQVGTPFEAAHLSGNPHGTFSYGTPRQDFVAIDTVAQWTDDEVSRRHAWELYRITGPPGAEYDLGRFWRDPDDPTLPASSVVIRGTNSVCAITGSLLPPASTSDTGRSETVSPLSGGGALDLHPGSSSSVRATTPRTDAHRARSITNRMARAAEVTHEHQLGLHLRAPGHRSGR